MARLVRIASLICLSAFSLLALAQQLPEGRLLRFPDIHNSQIVFSYGGDLWLVANGGGTARRITSHPGLELFPKFSPDGKWIAFTGQYDGNFNVYVMPAQGGQPRQLTFHPGGGHLSERMGIHNQVITWTPDSRHIVFLTRRDTFNDWFGRLYEISIDGGLPRPLPLPKGGLTSYSPDGNKIAYNQIFRNFRTWKRYTGGMAQDISIYDFTTHQIETIPHTEHTDTFPMWHGNTIYFTSDRGPEHRMNLYAYDLGTKNIRQLTHFTDFDLNWPSLGPGAIVFENAGYLYTFDLQTQTARKLSIYLPGDQPLARPRWVNVQKLISEIDISPDGKRAVLTARGDVFTVPAKEGSIRNLTHTPGIREKYATWSPDGRWIAYISDRSGEDELYITPQDGLGSEVRITTDGKSFRLPPVWSPDSKKILYADKSLQLFYVNIDEKKPVLVDRGKYADLTDYAWSPDSKWVAYGKAADNRYGVIYLYSLADRKITLVTTSANDSSSPYFDPAGRYLYFFSNRDFNEVLAGPDVGFANPKMGRVYVVTLRADLPSPFPVLSDEAATKQAPDVLVPPAAAKQKPLPTKPPAQAKPKKEAAAEQPPQEFRIDREGIQDRIVALPVPPANVQGLLASKDYIYYVTAPTQGLSGPLPGDKPEIHAFELKERKDHVVIEAADQYALSFDGTKLLYSAAQAGGGGQGEGEAASRTYGIIDAKPAKQPVKVGEGALNLATMRAEVDPRQEWKQIFNEVWRQERDYFFEPSMNGADWARERNKYAQLLPFVADRYDLTYVLGEMIGELSNSHTYVGGGDYPDLNPVNVGLLGADFEADTEHGLYRIKKIYPGHNWEPNLRSPLTEPGVTVKEGDYVLAVNGRPLHVPQNPYELFVNTVNQTVTLSVNSKPMADGAHNVLVRPIAEELGLHELNWIETNRRKVEAASGGRIGYVYLPDMGSRGLNAFVEQYFPQIRKQGIIFDVRYNGGGFVDQIIFERLRRVLSGMEDARNWEPDTIPPNTFYGYMACVTNHYAASDGDYFTYFFKKYKLGPVIGERTWGGVRGIRGEIPLMDGGYVTRPEFSLYGLDSHWLIENRGVDPDVVLSNRPDLVMKGEDPQLQKAIDMLMQEIQAHPRVLPSRPADLPAYPSGPGM